MALLEGDVVKSDDIDLADRAWLQVETDGSITWNGGLATKLKNSPDFEVCKCPFSVWEITGDTYDWRTDGEQFVAILRANQSTLECALQYMAENRVLVHNKNFPENL